MAPRLSSTLQRIRLRGGGTLTWREFGDPLGEPIFFFHGWPSEAYQGCILHDDARAMGWRIISPNRPGIGGSTRIPGRGLGDWPAPVRELSEGLGISRFAVVGLSGGGPYALACAHALPSLVRAVAVVSGAPPAAAPAERSRFHPVYRSMLAINDRLPVAIRGMLLSAVVFGRIPVPHSILRPAFRFLGRRDREVLSDPDRFRLYYPGFRNAMKSGAAGIHDDGNPYGRPWTFDPGEVRVPVHFWHGTDDRNFHWEPARDLASAIPGASFTLCAGEGHYSLVAARSREILTFLGTC